MPALLLAMAAAIALTGCGVRPTGIVEAGPPARGVEVPPTVYFLIGGKPRPVVRDQRPTVTQPTAALSQVLLPELFIGPRAAERQRGVTSELPRFRDFGATTVEEDRAVITLEGAVDRLSDLARSQLVCTVERQLARGDTTWSGTVVVEALPSGQQIEMPRCPADALTARPYRAPGLDRELQPVPGQPGGAVG